jgi:hypothetical protein
MELGVLAPPQPHLLWKMLYHKNDVAGLLFRYVPPKGAYSVDLSGSALHCHLRCVHCATLHRSSFNLASAIRFHASHTIGSTDVVLNYGRSLAQPTGVEVSVATFGLAIVPRCTNASVSPIARLVPLRIPVVSTVAFVAAIQVQFGQELWRYSGNVLPFPLPVNTSKTSPVADEHIGGGR